MPTGMQFGLLGPLVVLRDAAVVAVNQGKQRAVLAALLLNAGRVVSTDELAEVLWGSSPPPSARVSVQNYVNRLRKALGDGDHSLIATHHPGYLIRVAADELDVSRFEALAASARAAARAGSWDEAAAQATAALALWRGEPLADVESDALARTEARRLTEMRLQALETRIDADLHLGRHADAVVELDGLVDAYPLREGFHAQLMTALYASGRQAEALAAYQRARSALIDELGAEPGAQLRELHQRILAGDPVLAVSDAAPPAAPPAVPRELPPDTGVFTGREVELEALNGTLDEAGHGGPGTVVISAIGGTAGAGKTALALHWAHQVAGHFGDGQLYVNLRGFDPSGVPATAAEAIRRLLDALGVAPERIPASAEAQAGLYRSLLAGKRMLIVLDNARDERQVRPLLPAGPGSLVLVTSRNQLGGLAAGEGARLLNLDVLSHAEAVQLLTSRIGAQRAGAEPAAVDRIADLCGCLPLALSVAAARAATQPGFPLAALADELADSAGPLDALDAGEPGSSVRAVFSWSIRQLSPQAARMFRLLGLHPGPDLSVAAAASLAAVTEGEARRLLRELARLHLIVEQNPGRYAFHDLLRAYAADEAREADSESDRREAIGRVLDHYLHTAARAALRLVPSKEPVVLVPLRTGALAGQPADYAHALAWYEQEHLVLLAAVNLAAATGFDAHAWQLPWAMAPFLQLRGDRQVRAAILRTALAAATRLGDTAAQAVCSRLFAMACDDLGDLEQARRHFASSLTLYQRLGNRLGEAKIHGNLGVLAGRQGRHADALGHSERALRLCQAVGDKTAEADALNTVGWCHGLQGDYQQARAFCRRAVTLSAETGDRWLETAAWDSLGYAEHHLGNLAEAAASYQHALRLQHEFGARDLEAAVTLTHLADTLHAAGELAQAREAWHQALAILDALQHPTADEVRAKLASAGPTAQTSSA